MKNKDAESSIGVVCSEKGIDKTSISSMEWDLLRL